MNENLPISNGNDSAAQITYDCPKMNLIQRILGVIFSPGKVMQSLEQKPRILFALLLNIITPIVGIVAVYPMFKEFLRISSEAQAASMNLAITAEQIESTLDFSAIFAIVGVVFVIVGSWFLGSLILWGITKIFKGQGRYKQILSVTGYAAVISALATIASIITTQITGVYSEISFTSLASLIPDMKGSFVYGAAKVLEVFSIWQYVVIAIGAAAVSKLSKKKVYLIVTFIFACLVIYSGVGEVTAAAALGR